MSLQLVPLVLPLQKGNPVRTFQANMKRFTQTEKWDDPWFWELSPTAKLLWLFLCDHCDNAGVIDLSLKMASTKIGQTVKEHHLAELSSRLKTLECGKVFIRSFIRFQYGNLSRDCKPHVPVFASLARHGIDLTQIEDENNRVLKPFPKGLDREQEKEKEKDQEKDQERKEGVEGEIYHRDSRTALHWLNEKSGRKFRETDENLGFISARLSESGVDIEGIKKMIDRQCARWKGTDQAEYLRPQTLFNATKFDGYYAGKDIPLPSKAAPPEQNQLQEQIKIPTL